MRKAGDARLHPPAGFPKTGRHFDVAGLPDSIHLRTDPPRIANVLQGVRADYEVQFLVFERIRFLGADVAALSKYLGEHLDRAANGRNGIAFGEGAVVEAPGLVRRQIHISSLD